MDVDPLKDEKSGGGRKMMFNIGIVFCIAIGTILVLVLLSLIQLRRIKKGTYKYQCLKCRRSGTDYEHCQYCGEDM